MDRYNQGKIFTNSKCIGCNKCITVCPVMGANVSVARYGRNVVEVSKKCIECGCCVSACIHNARDYNDDTDAFFDDLSSGRKISLLVDPAFYIDYGKDAPFILGALTDAGINKIYDVAYGAEISVWAHAKYIKEHSDENGVCRQFIANNCAASKTFMENQHPELLPLMIPVFSPVMSTAVYVRKYLNDDSDLAYLGPCIASATQIKDDPDKALITYNVTFSHFINHMDAFDENGLSVEADLKTEGLGNLVSYRDEFVNAVAYCFPLSTVRGYADTISDSDIRYFETVVKKPNEPHPTITQVSACKDGCLMGAGVKPKDINVVGMMGNYIDKRHNSFGLVTRCNGYEEFYGNLCDKFADLNITDFTIEFKDKFKQPFMVPEDAIQDIFTTMHKETRPKQSMNCRSCGYKSCREFAIGVANGYARIQDCIHYMNDDLKYSVFIDRTTHILNTRGFMHKVKEMMANNPDKGYVVTVGNINRLKSINDLYGVEVGDKVIAYVAKLLSELCEGRGLCARFGGGVFALCVENKEENFTFFSSNLQLDCKHLGVYFPVTARWGTYIIQDRNEDLDRMTNFATYAAECGADRTKNTHKFFNERMRVELATESKITNEMQAALDDNEFVFYVQPQFDHTTGKIVGGEALSRWIKPNGEIVSPGVFIPVFEKNGFVKTLDKFCFENAFKLVLDWERSGKAIAPLSVNISRVSLETDDAVDIIRKLTEEYVIDKSHLHFEITESAYTKEQAEVTRRIGEIKDMGYEIAMDDFGSGYSSLNSLKDIPIDILKLDMGFLRGGTNVERGNKIIAHMVDMAKTLKLKMVAEGVETKEQADFLTKRGCNVIQGYYYAKPMPLPEYEKLLAENLGTGKPEKKKTQ